MNDPRSAKLLDAILERRSCRVYRPDAIPADVLKSVFEHAVHSPSAKNGQPWEVYVVTGEKLAQLKANGVAAFAAGRTTVSHSGKTPDPIRARAHELNVAMRPAIDAQGWEANEFIKRCISYFDAPAVAVICARTPVSQYNTEDVGMFAQTLCLAAHAYGLGSCILGYPLLVSGAIRETLAIPEEQELMLTVSLGYPAEGQPMAEFRSTRAPLDENVHFMA